MKKTTFLSFILCLLTSCSRLTVDNTPIAELNLNRYLGDWTKWFAYATLSDVDKARILDEARRRCYDVSKLIWVKQ
ncbi:MAG: hypothetical protein IJT19_01970 [Bacteroidaceae bacterium]|nr:hypothetical protein [Bacteroidaceae bacterium]